LGRIRVGAALAVLAMLAAACGSSKHNGNNTSQTTAPGGGGGTTTTLTPKSGGSITMGVEAEIDGFDPTKNRFDITGHLYATTIYDPLTQIGKDGKAHPYLAESFTPDSTYSTWTIKLRSGIQFTNGHPLTADVVVTDLTAQKNSALTGFALDNMASVAKGADDLTVVVTTHKPWTVFPLYMAGQLGYIYDPTSPDTVKKPIGTGPFSLKEWVPGDHMTAVKNPNYWQKGFPYLDSVTFKPILDQTARKNSLLSGTVDMIHTDYTQTIIDLRKDKSIRIIDTSQFNARKELDFYMINTVKPPFDDPNLRKALALATDRRAIVNTFGNGILKDATGPFSQGTPWYTDSGYPNYDLNAAKQLVDQWKAAHGGQAPTFQLDVTNTALSLQTAQFVQDMWQQAGFKLTINQTEQSQYILVALQGNYQVIGWRQFGEVDPDADNVWWNSTHALPIGQLALNFARNKNPQIDQNLATGRSSTDDATRIAAYQDIAKQFGKDIPYIWVDESLWAIASKPNVQGILDWTMPDGSPGADNLTIGGLGGGTIFLHVWLSS
jgi:peptide/nickel transport system substrate-binding protein